MRLTLDTAVALAIGLLIAIALLLPSPAPAQERPCALLDEALASLLEGYNERPILTARDPHTGMIFTADPDGGSWTVLEVDKRGIACLAASGDEWHLIEPKTPGVPS